MKELCFKYCIVAMISSTIVFFSKEKKKRNGKLSYFYYFTDLLCTTTIKLENFYPQENKVEDRIGAFQLPLAPNELTKMENTRVRREENKQNI